MEKVSQIETGREQGFLSDFLLLSWHQSSRLAPMENSQVPSSSQIICRQKKKKRERKRNPSIKTVQEWLRWSFSQNIYFFRFLTSFSCRS
jgi:hypothetical protein